VGLVCRLIFQPIIRLVEIVISAIEFVLIAICRIVEQLVEVVVEVLKYVCNTVVRTVCNAVCSLVCGICDFFCGIFGCDCGCRNVCNNVCKTITEVVCAWTSVLETVLQLVKKLVCDYLIQAIIVLLRVIRAIVSMVLTWVCTLIDLFFRWLVCWLYIAELWNSRESRRFRVAPKIIRNNEGHSDWFVYVNNPDEAGNVDQNVAGYILSDEGKPLLPVKEELTGAIAYYEVVTRENVITGRLRRERGRYVPGRPFLYYPHKIMEIASHLFGDIFAGDPADDGRGTEIEKNLYTYRPNVQAWLEADGRLATNNYNLWNGKYTDPSQVDYFGDRSLPDMGLRVDTDSTCSRPTNTFLHLVRAIRFTPPETEIAEELSCGPGQTLSFDETDFLMQNKDLDTQAVTTYFVSRFDIDDSHVGCNDLLGYTTVTARQGTSPLFFRSRVLAYEADTNRMMAAIVENLSDRSAAVVRVAETYLHELGHQCGLLHQEDAPDCADDVTLHITKLMHPGGNVRRAFTRLQWCKVRNSWYVTRRGLEPFTKTPELPDSGTVPDPTPAPPIP
jgi:hypothetical protein